MSDLTFSPELGPRAQKTLNDYEFLVSEGPRGLSNELGKGAYGSVRKVRDKQTGEIQAMKIMSKKSIMQFASKENLKREINIQKSLFHPNIIKLYGHFEDSENVYLVLEYAANGSLFHFLRKQRKLSEQQAFIFFLQTCLGIAYLHQRKILHRDLKPENLLLDKDSNIKLCDFGWSAENQTKRVTFCGTVDYMAPEMLKSQPYDHKLDIWCLGVLLYEMLHGVAPFKGRSDREKVGNIVKNATINFNPEISFEAADLIKNILKPTPSERYSMDDILRHPWMKKYEKIYGTSIEGLKRQQDDLTREYQMGLRRPDTGEYVGAGIYDNPYAFLVNDNLATNYQSADPFAKQYGIDNKGYQPHSANDYSSKNYMSGPSSHEYKSTDVYTKNYSTDYTSSSLDKYNQPPHSAGGYNYHQEGEREKRSRNRSVNEDRKRSPSEEYEEMRKQRRSGGVSGRRRRGEDQPGFWKRLLIGLGCIERRDENERF